MEPPAGSEPGDSAPSLMLTPRAVVCLAVVAIAAAASTATAQDAARRLNGPPASPGAAAPLLSVPGAGGTCTVARTGMAAVRRDSSVTRTLMLSTAGKESRRIMTTEDSRGQLVRVSDVSIAALENVEVRFEGARPRASWHTTNDAGMTDSAAAVAAERLAADLRRRCPAR